MGLHLTDQTALVTDSTAGIGLEIARKLVFYDRSKQRGKFSWPMSSANGRRPWRQTLSATPP